MERTPALLARVVSSLSPKDLLFSEHRNVLRERIELLCTEHGWDRLQFGRHIRSELHELRSWLSGAYELTADTLTEVCGIFHISIGDLVRE